LGVTVNGQDQIRGGAYFLTNLRCQMLHLIQCPGSIADDRKLELNRESFIPVGGWTWSSRVCIMNSFLLACQRCDMSIIQDFAAALVPGLLTWLQNGCIGDESRDILCVASAMQCLFTLLQRTKGFHCLERCHFTSTQLTVQALFQIAVGAISYSGQSKTDKYPQNTMRLAALKLLRVIVSIDQSSPSSLTTNGKNHCGVTKDSEYLSPGELLRVISILQGLENLDQNEEVRKLATHLLNFLRRR